MSMSNLLGRSRLSCSAFWAARNTRERTMLSAAAGVVACALIYALLVAPALTGREQLGKHLPLLREQLAQLQALSQQAGMLSGKRVMPTAAITRESIETALARHGLKAQSIVLTGDSAKVQLAAAPFSGMLAWLDDAQISARLYVIDANIVALAQTDQADVTLTLRQVRNE